MIPEFVTINEAAGVIPLSRPEIHAAMSAGVLPWKRIGGRKMIRWNDAYRFDARSWRRTYRAAAAK
ncbi:MAG TPA: hypothetical protein VFE60_22025 [Roseiarcus sp.]|jgi:hypothetical protein|nr:hypothetical protein [Roseiarcus sp.]